MSNKELVDKIVMFRTELERQNAGMGIMSLFDTICSYYGEQHRAIKGHLTTIESQNSQIESLKAITELAVNELKLLHESSKAWEMELTTKRIQETLDQIGRLQNGTTS